MYFAPVQGHTDAPYRYYHARIYGADAIYYTPFIRWEKGGVRKQDLKSIEGDMAQGYRLIPQIIFRDGIELNSLISAMRESGAMEIDLNMGCPFPLQTARGRGAATILNTSLADEVVKAVNENSDITFSVKMRLGLESPDEWHSLLSRLNEVSLSHVTLHPRYAKQQYGGEVYLDQFAEFLDVSKNPVVYNGDILTPEDAARIKSRFPGIEEIMIGRGALGRPSLIHEIASGEEWDRPRRLSTMLKFHRALYDHYTETLCGEHQALSKLKPFWEYAEKEIGRKAWKAIKKAVNMAKYHSAVAIVQDSL